jgi:pyridoxamine 5'-phosphate oxidase
MTHTPIKPTSPKLDLASERRDYTGQRLLREATPTDPFDLFAEWLRHALDTHILDATAMALSTASNDGRPSGRMVLLKGHDRRGLVFYTRYSTRKCVDLEENPRAALLLHWRELDRQVRVEGTVQRTTRQESQTYFATRPRSSQLAARAASGLERIPTAQLLEQRFAEEERSWEGLDVPTPEDWGGYRVNPDRMEFWQGRPNRLHDRVSYELETTGSWSKYQLAP